MLLLAHNPRHKQPIFTAPVRLSLTLKEQTLPTHLLSMPFDAIMHSTGANVQNAEFPVAFNVFMSIAS